jgi:hypothetical protein
MLTVEHLSDTGQENPDVFERVVLRHARLPGADTLARSLRPWCGTATDGERSCSHVARNKRSLWANGYQTTSTEIGG